jgi:YggT family protein
MAALAVLVGASNIFTRLAFAQRISVGYLLAIILQMFWSVFSTIIFFVILISIIRLIALLFAPKSNFELWSSLDRILYPVFSPISAFFPNSIKSSWKATLIICGIFFILANYILGWLASILVNILYNLPF